MTASFCSDFLQSVRVTLLVLPYIFFCCSCNRRTVPYASSNRDSSVGVVLMQSDVLARRDNRIVPFSRTPRLAPEREDYFPVGKVARVEAN
jgi:hypothetical protein